MSKTLILSLLLASAAFLNSTDIYAQDTAVLSNASNFYDCKTISSDADRLACYDNAAAKLGAAQENDELVTLKRSDIEKAKKDSFGLSPSSTLSTIDALVEKAATNNAPKAGAGRIDDGEKKEKKKKKKKAEISGEITLTIRETKSFGRDKTRFYFTNGQVWEQADSYRLRVPKPRNGKVMTAEIREAAFGSFLLRVNGKGRAVRVKRTR